MSPVLSHAPIMFTVHYFIYRVPSAYDDIIQITGKTKLD